MPVSRPSWLQPVGELGQGPLVVHHTKFSDVAAYFGLVLIRLANVRVERLTPAVSHLSHSVGNNAHFLKVDHIVDICSVTFMCKGHIFEKKGHERNDWWLQFCDCKSI